MAFTERPDRGDRTEAAAALARRAPELASKGAALAESFAVWQLPRLDAASSRGALNGQLVATGTWHHQVLRADSPPASLLVGEREGRIDIGVFDVNPLAAQIEVAISWADEHLDDEWEARLVFVPELLSHLFLFTKETEELLFPVSVPANPNLEGAPIKLGALLVLEAPSRWPSAGGSD